MLTLPRGPLFGPTTPRRKAPPRQPSPPQAPSPAARPVGAPVLRRPAPLSPAAAAGSREHIDQLQARRHSPRPAGAAEAPGGAPGGRAAQALAVGTDHQPHPLLQQYGTMATACAAWSGSLALSGGAGVANAFTGAGSGASVVAGTFSIATLVFSGYDSWLTFKARGDAQRQYLLVRQMLAAQYLLLEDLKPQLRLGPDPVRQAAWDLGHFNLEVLNRLLDGYERAYLPADEQAVAAQQRPLQLEHLRAADQALRRRQQALDHPDDPLRQASAARAAQRRDALQARIDALEASLAMPVLARLRRGLRHPVRALENLGDEQIALLRDGYLQAAKLPVQLVNTAFSTAVASLKGAGGAASGALVSLLGEVAAGLGLGLGLASLATAVLDISGGGRMARKARRGGLNELKAFSALVDLLHPQGFDPHADPAHRAAVQQLCLNLMLCKARQWNLAHWRKLIGLLRRRRGLGSLGNLLAFVLPGAVLTLAGVSIYSTLPGAVIGTLLGMPFIAALAAYLRLARKEKHLARRHQRQALAFERRHGPTASADLYAGRLGAGAAAGIASEASLRDNVYLSVAWLAQQLHAVAQEPEGAAPCDAERILIALGLPPNTLKDLRQAARLQSPAQHLAFARGLVTNHLGLKNFAPEAPPPEEGPAARRPAVEVSRTRAADAPAPFASLAGLSEALKSLDRLDLQRYPTRALRALRRHGFHRFATSRRTLKQLRRLESRGHTQEHEALQRSLLLQLLNQLPRREDGQGIAWPPGYEGSSGDCLVRWLKEQARQQQSGAMALVVGQRPHWPSQRLARRMEWDAELTLALLKGVESARAQGDAWWDGLIEPPVFLDTDKSTERAEEAPSAAPPRGQAQAPLPAYAIRV